MNFATRLLPALIACAGVVLLASAPGLAERPPSANGRNDDAPWSRPYAGGYADQVSRLEQALERYREIERHGGWRLVRTDLVMGPDYFYDCSSIAALERRLMAEGYLRRGSTPPPRPALPPGTRQDARSQKPPPQPERCKYGPALTEAMRAFQADRKVLGFGQVGKLTLAQLNRPVHEIVDTLEHDLARWRRVSLSPTGTYLLVNIPFFELIAYEDHREVMRMPVIVGLKTWQTPTFSDEIESIVINPDWGIPDSIAEAEYLPQARRDPNYLRRQGITASGGGLRQKPGPRNPLGRLKFSLPNQYDVYLHDTPEKRAFDAAVRALSHGCIRVRQPVDLANYLLRDDPEWTPRRLQAAIDSGATQHVRLRQPMPVHIIYSTSRVNDEGRVELRPDVYGKNRGALRDERYPRVRGDEAVDAGP